ncbi:MAG TPA: hypothetical protein VFH61_07270 [Thermoleophilia bacterium]|nr:hypothetical protein [Thermoleophilia bacterium]
MAHRADITDAERAEYYEYLVRLRDSGVTNMWGAAPYLAREHGLSEKLAGQVLVDWIESFSDARENA